MNIEKSFVIESYDDANYITEAFGIDGGYKKEILKLNLPDELPKVTYITGESGCGKSLLIKYLFGEQTQIEIPKDKPLFKWAENEYESLKLLSLVGLGDATLFISKYEHLSDSQQARARLYLNLISNKDVIVVDEFLSTLDRKTAKSVAYVFQKAIRKTGKSLVVATAHDDLFNFLQADLNIVGKAFPSRWEVYERKDEITNPFKGNIKISYKDKHWYKDLRLGELHYKGKYTGGTKDFISVELDGEYIGALVSTYRMHDGGRRISRVVIHPSYRGCGIGVELVKFYLRDNPTADVVASMAMYNPVFEHAGMKRVKDSEIKPPSGLYSKIKEYGFDKNKWYSKTYCLEFCKDDKVRRKISEYSKKAGYLVTPAGEYLSDEDVKSKILNEVKTCGRVLWGFRPRKMAKFMGQN